MDVSFTNVLEGARQYFQGLPVPSTGAATSVEHNLHATSSSTSTASSTSTTTHDHGAPSQPTQSTQSTSTAAIGGSGSSNTSSGNSNGNTSGSTSNIQESNRYATDVRPTSSMESSNTVAGSSFWNPHVEPPYPPQPTRVEVPDTRPGDEGTAMEPSSSSSSNGITLTEMQPSNHQSSSSGAVVAVTSNLPQRPSPAPSSASLSASASSSNDHNRHHHSSHLPPNSSSHLHQMQPPQPPLSPAPVYQQLNNVSMASFSAVEMLASSSTVTYQTASNNDRQAQPIVAQRTQYYPRYHHPDITKCAPAPYSQASIYQSANVAQPSNTVQQPSTRPTPIEQNAAMSSGLQEHRSPEQQRVSVNYGSNVPPAQSPLGGSIVYGSGSSSSVSSQSYRSAGQHQQQTHRLTAAPASCVSDRSHNTEGPHSSTSSSPPIISSRQITTGSSSSHIPPQSQNLPGHIPSPHLTSASSMHQQQHQQSSPLQPQQQQQQQQHTASASRRSVIVVLVVDVVVLLVVLVHRRRDESLAATDATTFERLPRGNNAVSASRATVAATAVSSRVQLAQRACISVSPSYTVAAQQLPATLADLPATATAFKVDAALVSAAGQLSTVSVDGDCRLRDEKPLRTTATVFVSFLPEEPAGELSREQLLLPAESLSRPIVRHATDTGAAADGVPRHARQQ